MPIQAGLLSVKNRSMVLHLRKYGELTGESIKGACEQKPIWENDKDFTVIFELEVSQVLSYYCDP